MKKILLTFLLVLLFSAGMEAQRRNGLISRRGNSNGSLVLSIGPNYSFADPDCSKGFFGPMLNQSLLSNYDISIGFRQTFSNDIGYKASISYDNFTGEDIKNPRGYSFVTSAYQFNVQGEYSYNWGKRYGRSTPNALYGFLGLGALYSIADLKYSSYNGSYIHKPKHLSPVIPYGFGYQYNFNTNYYIGAELKMVYTFSDYIDGFMPPTPQSNSNDIINGFSITLAYRIF